MYHSGGWRARDTIFFNGAILILWLLRAAFKISEHLDTPSGRKVTSNEVNSGHYNCWIQGGKWVTAKYDRWWWWNGKEGIQLTLFLGGLYNTLCLFQLKFQLFKLWKGPFFFYKFSYKVLTRFWQVFDPVVIKKITDLS